jgi:pectin methylesterase-like acyl-CoA thioesterase
MHPILFPAHQAADVNPDTHLVLTFSSPPALGTSGQIRIYDTADGRLVDTLDLSIPPGPSVGIQIPARPAYTPVPYEYPSRHITNANTVPGTPSGAALPTPHDYQLTIIGGFSDGFHFYPVIIHDNVATIYPHNNLLEYGKTYFVEIDPGVLSLSDGSFSGIGEKDWTFTTKPAPPPANTARLVVSGDGSGDFNTVQGAVDSIPDHNPERVTIFIRNGVYEELVYFRNKTNITFLGENREKVVVCYPNNETFNPHPADVATNEMAGTFPQRRVAFMVDHCSGIHLVNFTVITTAPRPGQAEALLVVGGQNILSHMTIDGSGDALQASDPTYVGDSQIVGDGDSILGRGPVFFERTELVSTGGPHMWIRNTAANHGNIFVNCTFRTTGNRQAIIARSPTNHGKNYPYCEAVLINCALAGVSPEGWGPVGGDPANVHYWEYNSTNLSDGKPADVSQRSPVSRQLRLPQDAEIITNYTNPSYVLGGWTPALAPLILAQPAAVTTTPGHPVTFGVKVAALPAASYQWFKNGAAIRGATEATLTIENVGAGDAAEYTVEVKNASGSVTSQAAGLVVK